jgi:hypothetical protein
MEYRPGSKRGKEWVLTLKTFVVNMSTASSALITMKGKGSIQMASQVQKAWIELGVPVSSRAYMEGRGRNLFPYRGKNIGIHITPQAQVSWSKLRGLRRTKEWVKFM